MNTQGLTITSPSFAWGQPIPRRHTADGEDVSPALEFHGVPEGGAGEHAQGENDFGKTGYGGPAPPAGHGPHHYYFWLHALDEEIGAAPTLTRMELLDRMEGHIIEQNRLVGTYER